MPTGRGSHIPSTHSAPRTPIRPIKKVTLKKRKAMTDEEIKSYVASQMQALKDGMIDIASLPQALPEAGTTLPFVRQETLVASPVEAIASGGDDRPLATTEIDAALAEAEKT